MLIDEIWKRSTIKIRIDNRVNFREREILRRFLCFNADFT